MKNPKKFKLNDVVDIKCIQGGPVLKLKPNIFARKNNIYDVQEIGFRDSLTIRNICTEYMKPWLKET